MAKQVNFVLNIKAVDFFHAYLKTINGLLNLSPQEIKVLAEILRLDLSFRVKGVYDIPGVSPFSKESRKAIQKKLALTPQNLNNYIKSIKDKGLIMGTDSELKINPKIGGMEISNHIQIIFNFNLSK